MLFLMFRAGEDAYVLEAGRIEEILPLVRIRTLPDSARSSVGIVHHRDMPLPVVDLSALLLGRPSRQRLSTRIVLVSAEAMDDPLRQFGLVVEEATQLLQLDPAGFVPPGFARDAAPYLGPIIASAHGLLHRIEPDRLLAHAYGGSPLPQPAGAA
ncbi:chemotaxis protein CheW [Pseudoroseomonas globiformis]|uniref:Chemotaxis protein CheW n=1 Tax=Teichococcus globiformis TaxID=2307229 RepID=A0ABV7G8X3_9PROT